MLLFSERFLEKEKNPNARKSLTDKVIRVGDGGLARAANVDGDDGVSLSEEGADRVPC